MKAETFTTEESRKIGYTYVLLVYSKVVLAIITEKDSWKKAGTYYRLMRRATYEKYKSRKSLRWTLKQDELQIVSKTYLRYYLDGKGLSYDTKKAGKPRYTDQEKWLEIIESGQLERVVDDRAWNDGYFYGVDGKPVRRTFHFDYIRSYIRSTEYDFGYDSNGPVDKMLLGCLRAIPGVSNAIKMSIPWYNNDEGDDEGIEYDFTPSPQFFGKMIKAKCPVDGGDMIRNLVRTKLARFRKKVPNVT